MPETVTKYRVFIASPSDLCEERQAISDVINELNLGFGQQNNIVLELVKWETHSAPGINSVHPQEIINVDIDDNYDLFIGLMWMKFGTKTKVAESGTEEEYKRAYTKFKDNPDSLQILFYFKTTPPDSLQDIDLNELAKVNQFKESIGEENVLYWNFTTIEKLQAYLRLHIPKRIGNLKDSQQTTTIVKQDESYEVVVQHEEELGLFDYLEIAETKFELSTNSILNITGATEWIGEKMHERTEEITSINKTSNNYYQPNVNLLRRVFKLTAQAMNEYASRLNVENPIFYDNFEDGMKAFSGVVNIADDFFTDKNIDELIESKESIVFFVTQINNTVELTEGYYQSVLELPRIDKGVNKAKRNVLAQLKLLISNMKACSQLGFELINEMSDKINRIEIAFANKELSSKTNKNP